MTDRATVCEDGFLFTTFVDGVTVERGTQDECTKLMDELNASNRKCDMLKKIMED